MTIVAIAASYLTLGVFAVDDAERYWWAYTIVTLILAAAGVYLETREDIEHDLA